MAHAGVVSHSSSGLEDFFKSNGEIAVFPLGMAIQDLAIFTVLIRSRSRTVGRTPGFYPISGTITAKGPSMEYIFVRLFLSVVVHVRGASSVRGAPPAGPHLVVYALFLKLSYSSSGADGCSFPSVVVGFFAHRTAYFLSLSYGFRTLRRMAALTLYRQPNF